ncbi:hypothetical protein [Streptomyces sp. NBC_01207]|uniref:hypothetical protein n=1 Tax=Streptomyces sp. NBC_01207 TaxID=2903772 RepID=UPI002E0FDBF8
MDSGLLGQLAGGGHERRFSGVGMASRQRPGPLEGRPAALVQQDVAARGQGTTSAV